MLIASASSTDRCIGQPIGFRVILPRHMRDGKNQRARQFATDPVQRIKARTAAGILSAHLPHYHLRIRVNVQFFGVEGNRALQRFQEGRIFGDVVILMSDPFGDPDFAAFAAIYHHSNARRPRISQRTAVHIGHKVRHQYEFFRSRQDALKQFLRQDDYLVRFQAFSDVQICCAFFCEKRGSYYRCNP